MIPALILMLLKKFRHQHPLLAEKLRLLLIKIAKPVLMFLATAAIAYCALSQERKLDYAIKRNGNEVGEIRFMQSTAGNRTTMKLESEVSTRFVFLFTAKANEEAIYDNGILTWSSIFRKLNGNIKADKKTKATGSDYTIYEGKRSSNLNNYPIRYNMLSLYSSEPASFSKVYSDNYQVFLDVQKIAANHYKIKFPDGNYNEYFYKNGICAKIDIHHTLYSATIELKM